MSDLDFLDDLDDAGGYIASSTIHRRHTFAPPTPVIGASGLNAAERRARQRVTPPPARPDEEWENDGACKGSTLDFFPDPHQNTDRQKQLCATCPVKNPCLEYALAHQEHGIWGGTGERERARIRRQRPRAS